MKVKQLSIFLENKTGRINEVAKTLGKNGVNMIAFSLAESTDFGILRLLVSDTVLAVKVLKDAHFAVKESDVVRLVCPNEPGSLAGILDSLSAENIFIEYMYAFACGDAANIVIRPTDMDRCIEVLGRKG
ncbi:MAG: amino acid-binding protein [Bacteroidales bacterium]